MVVDKYSDSYPKPNLALCSPGNALVTDSIEHALIVFAKNYLDTITIDTLYKTVRAMDQSRSVRKKLSMLTSRTHKEHSTKWQPCAAMNAVVCSLGLTLSATNIFGGRLGQETSIDSRQYKI